MEYASNGKANAALTTGIIGTAGVGLGLLGNLLGGGWGMNPAAAMAAVLALWPAKREPLVWWMERRSCCGMIIAMA